MKLGVILFFAGALVGGLVLGIIRKPDNSLVKHLTAESDSLRKANKAITDSLIKTMAKYRETDSMLQMTLLDTNRIKIKYVKIRDAHAALPVDSATQLFLDAANGQR